MDHLSPSASVDPEPLPPGPRGKLRTTWRLLKFPYEVFPQWAARYGDPFTLDAVNGRVFTTGRAELVKQIFAQDPAEYLPFAVAAVAPLVGDSSVFVIAGEAHRRERKLLMPPFHGERMRTYADAMQLAARRHFEAGVEASADRAAPLLETTQALTLEVILRAVFGVDDEGALSGFAEAITDTVAALHPAFVFMPALAREFGGIGPYARFVRRFAAMDRLLRDQIERVRARPAPGEDVLSLMLAARYDDGSGMDEGQIRDELVSVVVAGHETTAITLAWCIDQLARHPELLARLREELDALGPEASPAQLAASPLLGAVCDETLRRFPVVTEALRTLRSPLRLGEHEVPAGDSVAVSTVLVHFDPERWPEPLRWRPDRFLEGRPGPQDFLPFGGGHRRCLGAAFASYELRVVLGTFVREFEVELAHPDPEPVVRRNLTMAPGRGVPARIRRR